MILAVYGGSGSGKSSYAEKRVIEMEQRDRVYLATMNPFGREAVERIARHRKMREQKMFRTIERHLDVGGIDSSELAGATVLLEDLSNLIANELFDSLGSHQYAEETVLGALQYVASESENFVIVLNDVFSDGRYYDKGTRDFLAIAGRLNLASCAMADNVVEVVCGLPVVIR